MRGASEASFQARPQWDLLFRPTAATFRPTAATGTEEAMARPQLSIVIPAYN